MPKVSAIVPAFNGIKYLPQTIDSIVRQTYQDWKIIIVKDGSTDAIKPWYVSIL